MLPELQTQSQTRDMITAFTGYNHQLVTNDGEWYDMKNLTSDYYPVLSPRAKRSVKSTLTTPNGLFSKNGLVYVDGTSLYYKGSLVGTVENSKKQFVGMGAYVAIFPDKKYFNTADETPTIKSMGQTFQTVTTVTYTPCTLSGASITVTKQDSEPTKTNGAYWLDTSTTPSVLKMYQESTSQWVSVPTSYIKIGSTNIGKYFNKQDIVTISGSDHSEFNMDMCIWEKADDYIVVIAMPDNTDSQVNTMTLERKIPDLDYVTESENRIWGCNSSKHEIYCCKQGDCTNWYSYLGIASDSYAATVGSDGDFTGACTCLGYVLFFKEDCIHKVQGSMPSNYTITNVTCRGVQKGSEGSLQVVNETLFYKSSDGVCIYQGGLPGSISSQLGNIKYKNASAGQIDSKYYISMQDYSDTWHMFSYDTEKGMWNKEDNTHAIMFTRHNGDLYFIDGENKLSCVKGTDGTVEGAIEWYCETGNIGMNLPDRKYISMLSMRFSLEIGGYVEIYCQYDSDGIWHKEMRCDSKVKKSSRGVDSYYKLSNHTIPIKPRRCDHMRIKLVGKGDCKLYSMSKVIEQGSDV